MEYVDEMTPVVRAQMFRDAADVMRYHTQRMIRTQSVGAHSFNMLLLLDQLCPNARKEVFLAVMHHDLPELHTGDMPAPIKRLHPGLKVAMEDAEMDLAPLFREDDLTPNEALLVKFCDTMELTMYCIEEMRMGNGYAALCVQNGIRWMWETPAPLETQTLLTQVSKQALGLGVSIGPKALQVIRNTEDVA